MHMPFFIQPFSKLVRKPSTGDCSEDYNAKAPPHSQEDREGFIFSLVVLSPVS